MSRPSPIPLAIILAAALCACSSSKPSAKKEEKIARAAEFQLQEICQNYNRTVHATARKIRESTEDSSIHRRTIEYKMVTYETCRRVLLIDNRLVAFLDLWTLSHQRLQYLRDGGGKEIFKSFQPLVVETEARMADYIGSVCAKLFPPEAYEYAEKEVLQYAADHPIKEGLRQWNTGDTPPGGQSVFGSIVGIFPSLGIKETAGSISEVAQAVDEVGTVVQDLPQMARWNVDLLLLDLNENDSMRDLRGGVREVSQGVTDFVEIADKLPEELQTQISKTIDEVDEKQEGLQTTIKEVKGVVEEASTTVAEVNTALDKVDATVVTVDRVTENFAEAGRAWEPTIREARGLFRDIEGPPPTEPPPPPDPDAPDDLENLARTAEGLTAAATELRGTISELRELLDGDGLDKIQSETRDTIDHTSGRVAGLVDQITLRAVLAAAGIAVVVLLYRLASVWLVRSKGAGSR